MVDLTIIIVTYNSLRYLQQCLQSIADSKTQSSYRIIIVDNNSDDGTVEFLTSRHPSCELVTNNTNAGFAYANNQALRQCNDSRYVMLLNPDTIVRPGALDAMVEFLDAHGEAWALGPAMLNGDGSPQRTGVRFPSNWNIFCESVFLDRVFPHSQLYGAHRDLCADFTKPRVLDYVQGSCLMVRREVIQKVGLLDESFFMYFEETDWCYRMKHAGGHVMFLPDAEVIHFGGGELAHYDERRLICYHESLLRFYRKHYSHNQSITLKTILFCRSIIRIVAWGAAALLLPRSFNAARSSVRGYVRVFPLLFKNI